MTTLAKLVRHESIFSKEKMGKKDHRLLTVRCKARATLLGAASISGTNDAAATRAIATVHAAIGIRVAVGRAKVAAHATRVRAHIIMSCS